MPLLPSAAIAVNGLHCSERRCCVVMLESTVSELMRVQLFRCYSQLHLQGESPTFPGPSAVSRAVSGDATALELHAASAHLSDNELLLACGMLSICDDFRCRQSSILASLCSQPHVAVPDSSAPFFSFEIDKYYS